MWSNKFSPNRYSNSYDMFMRGEEILSGAQRIHNPQVCILAIFGYLKADRLSSIWHFLLVPDWESKVARCGSWHHCLLHRFIQVKNMMFDISESRTFFLTCITIPFDQIWVSSSCWWWNRYGESLHALPGAWQHQEDLHVPKVELQLTPSDFGLSHHDIIS